VELWARMLSGNFAEMTTSTPFRDLLHAANLRHGCIYGPQIAQRIMVWLFRVAAYVNQFLHTLM